jgi:hypothetical protein
MNNVKKSRIAPRQTRIDRDSVNGYQIRYNRHPLRQNNFKVGEMYDCYKDGMSLSMIAKLYVVTRQAVYDVFHSRGYPLRSKKLEGATTWNGVRYTFDGAGFLRGTRNGKREYLHKAVWERANGPLLPKYVLLHRDGDKTNNALENLEELPMSKMQSRFNPTGRNQYSALSIQN